MADIYAKKKAREAAEKSGASTYTVEGITRDTKTRKIISRTPTTPTAPDATIFTPSPTSTTKEQQLAGIEAKIASIAERFGGIKETITTEGITTAGGQVLLAPTIPEYKTTAPDLTEAKSLTEFYRKQIEIQQKQATEAKGAYEEYLKTSAEQQKTWWEKIMAKPTITETAEEYYEKLGIKPEEYFAERSADIAAVDKLMQEYDTAVAAKQMALVREEERLAPMEFISARMNRVEKEANIRLSLMAAGVNTKLAVMEMKEGNFEQARSLVQEAVTNYTNDLKWEYQMFVDFREQNQEIISELDKKYQTALDKAEQYALLSWQKKEEDTTNIANLMLQYPKAGIKFGDSIQDATRKASGYAAVTPDIATQVIGSAETGYSLLKIDQKTGNVIGITPLTGGTGVGGLSKAVQADFIEDLTAISTLGSRENALTTLEKNKTALITKYGANNYQALLNEVDRLFPISPEKAPTPVTPLVSPGAFETGARVGGIFGAGWEEMKESFLYPYVGKPLLVVEDFFKGLFGR